MNKINSISIKGLRGIKEQLNLDLNKKSILLYGDNASGKSSITDAIEWFFSNRIEHLSGEEISRGGLEALRNISLPPDKHGFINIQFTDNKLNSEKQISLKMNSIDSKHLNETTYFDEYLLKSDKENLILRYKDLVSFILSSKKEKLDDLSKIIGFSPVTNVRETLKKVKGDLKKELKIKDFDNKISHQQSYLIEYLESTITSNKQFINALNELIEPLNINKKISELSEIEIILNLIKMPEDSTNIELHSFYNKVSDWIKNLPVVLDELENTYQRFSKQFNKLASDIERINKILLEKLLSEGVYIINKGVITDDICPLCLLPKSRMELLQELEIRIKDLEEYKKDVDELKEQKDNLLKVLNELGQKADGFSDEQYMLSESNKDLLHLINIINMRINAFLSQSNIEVSSLQKIKPIEDLLIDRMYLKKITKICKQKKDDLKKIQEDNSRIDISNKIVQSRTAYLEIQNLKKEKEVLEAQESTFHTIYTNFIKKQKEGLESFLDQFSNNINEYYQFMNPDEKVENIKFVTIEKNDELLGITMQYDFFDKRESPPQKYLSESHLNCLGIAFFLSSVKAFNKRNKFFILDDVISSFDSTHRKRFTDLLIEKFSDYQIILLTHERNWFEIVRNLVKGKNWEFNIIKWNSEKGTFVDEPIEDIKERIILKMKKSDTENLGNSIRTYLENILKKIANNFEVKVKFMFNDRNEDRMSFELLTAIKSKFKGSKYSITSLDSSIDRLLSSVFIGNKDSHDATLILSLSDFKAFWADVKEFEKFFICPSCSKLFTLKNYDFANSKIICSCKTEINLITK